MANNKAYWQRLEAKQKSAGMVDGVPVAREASPITIQIPQTGRQMLLERSYLESSKGGVVRIHYMSESLYSGLDLAICVLAVALVSALFYAARRLKMWIEALLIGAFLVIEVALDLVSASLARHFLDAAIVTIITITGIALARRALRSFQPAERIPSA